MIIANWKANGNLSSNLAWHKEFVKIFIDNNFSDIGIAPSNIHFTQLQELFKNLNLKIGLQDIDFNGGARTGSISPSMASDAGCDFTLIGHSERRDLFKEDNTVI